MKDWTRIFSRSQESEAIPRLLAWPYFLADAGRRVTGLATSRGFLSLVDQGVASAGNFLTGVIIGRACTKDEFGAYFLGFTIVQFISLLQSSLIMGPFSVFVPRLAPLEQAGYFASSLFHQLGSSLLAVILLGGGGIALSLGFGPPELIPVISTLVITLSLLLLREYARQVAFAYLRVGTALAIDLSVVVLQVSGLLWLASYQGLTASRAYWVAGVACGLPTAIWLLAWRRRLTFRFSQVWTDFKRNWAFGKWVVAHRAVYIASNQLYPWMLASFSGAAATGVLAACLGTIYLANPFLMGMGNYLGPKTAHAFASGGSAQVQKVVSRESFLFLLIMGPFCALMFLFGDKIMTLMYGAKYAGHGLTVAVLALAQFIQALTLPASSGLAAIERPDVGFKGSLLALAAMLFLGIWLVKLYGPLGVGLGLLAGNIAMSLYRWVVFNRECRLAAAAQA